jgi:ATP-dependent Lhr-like helicase
VAAEGAPGGYSVLYPVLRALEDQGRVRRGYFIAGLGGSQFADPGALERLRALRGGGPEPGASSDAFVLASTDPANAYGAALGWPPLAIAAARTPGTHVVLVGGWLAVYLGREEQQLAARLPDQEPERSRVGRGAARAVADWCRHTGRQRLAWGASGASAIGPFTAFLREAGFTPSGRGLRLTRSDGGA